MRRINAGHLIAGGSPLRRIRKPHSSGVSLQTYAELIEEQFAGQEVFFYKLNETAGPTAVDSFNANNATYSGATLDASTFLDGSPVPLFDGINDLVNILAPGGWEGLFNGAEGTISAWVRVFNAGVWTDAVARWVFALRNNLTADILDFQKTSANSIVVSQYRTIAGGISTETVTFSSIDWFHVAITWTDSGNVTRHFINGVQQGTDDNVAAAWGAAPNDNWNAIGARRSTGTSPWHGNIANVVCGDIALPDADILAQYDKAIALSGLNAYDYRITSQMAGEEVFYYKLDETSGTNAVDTFNANDATYSGVTLDSSTFLDGTPAPLFDGINDFVDILTPGGWEALFDGAEGTLSCWVRVFNVGVWTDGTFRRPYRIRNGSDNLTTFKSTANDLFVSSYVSNTGGSAAVNTALSTTDWFHIATVWTDVGNYVRHFVNGVQTGVDVDVAAPWGAAPNGANNAIGANNTTPTQPWHGYIRNVACASRALTDNEILAQYNTGIALGA